jgi:hypothetical protein
LTPSNWQRFRLPPPERRFQVTEQLRNVAFNSWLHTAVLISLLVVSLAQFILLLWLTFLATDMLFQILGIEASGPFGAIWLYLKGCYGEYANDPVCQ